MHDDAFSAAREFIRREARVLEQRLFAVLFEQAGATGVVDALRGFRNADGGFGHGLEPDKRCPSSLPIDVEIALKTLAAAETFDAAMVTSACEYLASVASPEGAVPLAFPVIEDYPHAEHWASWAYVPGLNPTAGLVGHLTAMGVDHPWVASATEYCWTTLEEQLPKEAHAMWETCIFLEVADRPRAEQHVARVAEMLPNLSTFRHDPDDPGYGVTALHFAPAPDSYWRRLFDDGVIERSLDRLERDQQADGGWPLSWQPPSAASVLEYRGIETIRALRVLGAYGRLVR
jgi:hypothetical protein